jgi:hypothetical protein
LQYERGLWHTRRMTMPEVVPMGKPEIGIYGRTLRCPRTLHVSQKLQVSRGPDLWGPPLMEGLEGKSR